MSLLNSILNAQDGAMVESLAGQFGLDRKQAQSALAQLVPALGKGVSNNIAQADGLSGLIGALTNGKHARYLEQPAQLTQADTVNDGNAILGHLFGSKEVSRQVARSSAAKTGLSDDVLKKMLPVVATMVMGALSKQTGESGGGLAAMLGGAENSGSTNMLTSFLDADGDGSIADDVLGMLFKR